MRKHLHNKLEELMRCLERFLQMDESRLLRWSTSMGEGDRRRTCSDEKVIQNSLPKIPRFNSFSMDHCVLRRRSHACNRVQSIPLGTQICTSIYQLRLLLCLTCVLICKQAFVIEDQ